MQKEKDRSGINREIGVERNTHRAERENKNMEKKTTDPKDDTPDAPW